MMRWNHKSLSLTVVALSAWLGLSGCLGLYGCGNSGDSTPGKTSQSIDTVSDSTGDATTDGGGDAWLSDAAEVTAATCPGIGGIAYPETVPPDVKRNRFAVSLFHFNIEYVIGGLEWDDADGSHIFLNKDSNKGWGDAKVEDYIVEETFYPLLQMYEKHPDWGVDFEMQGRMVDVMAKRHPQVLALLQKLAWRGQAELISFHYSDQLFLAFPRDDLHRSIAATRKVFADNCLPLSGVVFNQEGQAGEGRQKVLVAEGYQVGLFPKNLWSYQHSAESGNWWPLYSSEGGDLIVAGGGIDGTASGAGQPPLQLSWNYYDDGELRAVGTTAVGPNDPYMAPTAPHDPARVAEFEAELAATQASGAAMLRIGDYVRHLKAKNIPSKPAPPLLDGTWQPGSTDSLHRWLGGHGPLDAVWEIEQDGPVRVGNTVARNRVLALEQFATYAGKQGLDVSAVQKALPGLWESLWRAEVSDCSGVNPWFGEVQFGLTMNETLQDQVSTLAKPLLQKLGKANSVTLAMVDLQNGGVTLVDHVPNPNPTGPEVDPPLPITLTSSDRPVTAHWFQVGEKHWEVHVAIKTSTCASCDTTTRAVGMYLPLMQDAIEVSPGLLDDEVRTYPFSAFAFAKDGAWLPLGNGLVGLGQGWYMIEDWTTVHTAVGIFPGQPWITLLDETIPIGMSVTWNLHLFQGTQADALALARTLNIYPVVRLQ